MTQETIVRGTSLTIPSTDDISQSDSRLSCQHPLASASIPGEYSTSVASGATSLRVYNRLTR